MYIDVVPLAPHMCQYAAAMRHDLHCPELCHVFPDCMPSQHFQSVTILCHAGNTDTLEGATAKRSLLATPEYYYGRCSRSALLFT